MKRFGPLHASRQTLLIGDPGHRHLVLAEDGVRYRNEHELVASHEWDSIFDIRIEMPTTRFRFPGLVSGVVLSAIAIFIQDDPSIGPKDGTVTITIRNEKVTYPLSRHHLGGYWARSSAATQRLVDQLIMDASSRALLRHPGSLIRAAAAAARRRT